ncbi:MAG: 3-phosphoshikimate 1-carboxyvinyltransferase [Gammaproteobacteria bacterium]|nr:MAG: 3-phosphoshikimate 1-carboxyvinyltransferase [Gammaproteobacteria bacterium]
MHFLVQPSVLTGGEVTVPGDKSISHRALLLGALAEGETVISGFLAGEDCLATLAALRKLGVACRRDGDTGVTVQGVGLHGLTAPTAALDLGNSGTAMRLFAGLLSGQPFASTLCGDASLSARPMRRVITPLSQMGADIESHDGMPPLTIHGRQALTGIRYDMPVASAQVKSAVLLAGLYADGVTEVREKAVTRDHTERMLRSMGVALEVAGKHIVLGGGQKLRAIGIQVPGDLSSAAFVVLAAILAQDCEVLVRDVGVNPTRSGVLDILRDMGADLTLHNERLLGQEPVADIAVRSSRLQGIDVDPALVSLAIDEFPLLFVAAAVAAGRTRFAGIGELRVKESDRIAAMASGLRTLGVRIDESADGAVVHGGPLGGGTLQSCGDHRIAMAFAVAGSVAASTVKILDTGTVNTSFPGFIDCMVSIGVNISTDDSHAQG